MSFDSYRHLNGHVVWKVIRDIQSSSTCDVGRVPPLDWHHSQALTLASRKGRKLGPGQEIAIGNLMIIGRAGYSGHRSNAISIVTSHLHTAETGQASRDL